MALQHLLPQLWLSGVVGRIARTRAGWIRKPLIRAFMRGYRPEMADALQPNPLAYESFNAFFTRALRPGARPQPMEASAIVSPVDGSISALGSTRQGRIIQAKGRDYSLVELLAGDSELADRFSGGSFMTVYLAPFNYHRIHMALPGTLTSAWYVPGHLYSVNDTTAALVPNLFARNERVVCVFTSPDHGPFVMVLVGATIVGSMATAWHGVVNPKRTNAPSEWTYADQNIILKKGEEMGRFLLGSTIIMLFERNSILFSRDWTPERSVRLGEAMGNRPV